MISRTNGSVVSILGLQQNGKSAFTIASAYFVVCAHLIYELTSADFAWPRETIRPREKRIHFSIFIVIDVVVLIPRLSMISSASTFFSQPITFCAFRVVQTFQPKTLKMFRVFWWKHIWS